MGDLDGKVAVVTGGASGIGEHLVNELVDRGADVLAADLDEGRLVERAASTGCATRVVDVADAEQNRAMIADAVERWGRLDLAFLNAGVLPLPTHTHLVNFDASEMDLDHYDWARRINLDGVVYGIVAAAKAMKDCGGGGIVCTASTAGIQAFGPDPIYAITKRGVVAAVVSMAPGLRTHGVTLEAICPAVVATPMTGPPSDLEALEQSGFALKATDVAHAMIEMALEPETGRCTTMVAGRDDLVQVHEFDDKIEGFEFSID